MTVLLTKRCARCQLDLSLASFHLDRTRVDGLATMCRECRSETAAARYARDREKILEKCHEYFDANKPEVLARNAAWRAAHPVENAGYCRKHRAKVKAEQHGGTS